jgi:hypothetical protein
MAPVGLDLDVNDVRRFTKALLDHPNGREACRPLGALLSSLAESRWSDAKSRTERRLWDELEATLDGEA